MKKLLPIEIQAETLKLYEEQTIHMNLNEGVWLWKKEQGQSLQLISNLLHERVMLNIFNQISSKVEEEIGSQIYTMIIITIVNKIRPNQIFMLIDTDLQVIRAHTIGMEELSFLQTLNRNCIQLFLIFLIERIIISVLITNKIPEQTSLEIRKRGLYCQTIIATIKLYLFNKICEIHQEV